MVDMVTEVSSKAQAAVSTAAPVAVRSAPLADVAAVASPKVQERKQVDIKVDVEAMRANLKDSIHKLNESMRDGGRNLNFHIDDKVGGPVVLVKNADTGEVVRQIPNEVVVRIAHSIEAFKGLLHNELT
jgi:flagellar protein FlaG